MTARPDETVSRSTVRAQRRGCALDRCAEAGRSPPGALHEPRASRAAHDTKSQENTSPAVPRPPSGRPALPGGRSGWLVWAWLVAVGVLRRSGGGGAHALYLGGGCWFSVMGFQVGEERESWLVACSAAGRGLVLVWRRSALYLGGGCRFSVKGFRVGEERESWLVACSADGSGFHVGLGVVCGVVWLVAPAWLGFARSCCACLGVVSLRVLVCFAVVLCGGVVMLAVWGLLLAWRSLPAPGLFDTARRGWVRFVFWSDHLSTCMEGRSAGGMSRNAGVTRTVRERGTAEGSRARGGVVCRVVMPSECSGTPAV